MDFLDPHRDGAACQIARRTHRATSYLCLVLLVFMPVYLAASHAGVLQ